MATTTANPNDSGSGKFTFVIVLIVIVALASFLIWVAASFKPENQTNTGSQTVEQGLRGGMTEQEVILHTTDFTDDEWNTIANNTAGFNLDVYIASSHAAEGHGSDVMNAALRACSQNGTISIISENFTRRLHLLCRDEESKKEYVVIIEKIKRSVDSFRNSTSNLITAFQLEEGSGFQGNIAAYINSEVNFKGSGVLIRLAFKAGELFFSPYK